MFIPNNRGVLSSKTGVNSFAEPVFSPGITVQCAVIHLDKKTQKTTVRADSSGSRGAADEFISISRLLFPVNIGIKAGDRFQIAGMTLRATGIEPRYSVRGNLDHYEVDFEQWT